MAGLLASLLPGAIRGIGALVKGKPIGEALGEAFIQPSKMCPNAADLLPNTQDIERLKKMPTVKERVILNSGGAPEERIINRIIIKKKEPISKFKTIKEIDDKLDIIIGKSDARTAEILEDKIDEIEDKKLSVKKEIRMKKRLLL